MILGIDTGGTFTDGVIVNAASGNILVKAKSLTTKNDLSIGIDACIEQCIRQMPSGFSPADIKQVNLSTTLATNAVVEGKKSRVGLIASNTRDLKWKTDVEVRCDVSGRMELDGEEKEPIDSSEVLKAVKSMEGKIDALVVSGYACVRNPLHEQQIRQIAAEHLDVPIVCAHELTSALGFNERTATAILNAHLLPVIDILVKKTAQSLQAFGIDAPVYFMKGDGAMISESQARMRPVETVLSGPAASVSGGAFLTDAVDAFVVDIGGTTLDIASMENGTVSVNDEGSVVGGWQTKVRAADIFTTGLGGDSRFHVKDGIISFGPEKAIPACCVCEQYPYYIRETADCIRRSGISVSGMLPFEGLILNDVSAVSKTGELGRKMAELLRDGPHCAAYIAEKLSVYERVTGFRQLAEHQLISIISVTPTDLLHAKGVFTKWDADGSKQYLRFLADYLRCDADELPDMLTDCYKNQLTKAIVKSILYFEGADPAQIDECRWLDRVLFDDDCRLRFGSIVKKPIVALGASAGVWLCGLTDRMDADVRCPEHADVANAAGAAKGVLGETIGIVITYNMRQNSYHVHLPWETFVCDTYEEAKKEAMNRTDEKITELEERDGVAKYSKDVSEEKYGMTESEYTDGANGGEMVARSYIKVRLSGVPRAFDVSM